MAKKRVAKYDGGAKTSLPRSRRKGTERIHSHSHPFDRSISNLHRLTLDLKKMLGLGAYVPSAGEATRS